MIGKETLRDEMALRCANLVRNIFDLFDRTPVPGARIERVQDYVCVGIEMLLNKLSSRVITRLPPRTVHGLAIPV